MSRTQHAEAERLLSILAKTVPNHQLLTYGEAAVALGRKASHARPVAQICSLLDAAAVLAGTPLLALLAVRDVSKKINDKAWRLVSPKIRQAIISRSSQHDFVRDDFAAIKRALDDLPAGGTVSVWKWLLTQKAYEEFCKGYSEKYVLPNFDSIDDLGSDRPKIIVAKGTRYARDPWIRKAVIQRAGGKCEFCGEPGFICSDGSSYLECHHIIALAKEGADRMTNVIALCPGDHREAHFGKRRQELETRMIHIVTMLEQKSKG